MGAQQSCSSPQIDLPIENKIYNAQIDTPKESKQAGIDLPKLNRLEKILKEQKNILTENNLMNYTKKNLLN